MNEQTEQKISMFLNEPRTVYQLCADTGLSYSHVISCLQILEAKKIVKKDRSPSTKKTYWSNIDSTTKPPIAAAPVEIKPKKSKKSKKVVEDGEVE